MKISFSFLIFAGLTMVLGCASEPKSVYHNYFQFQKRSAASEDAPPPLTEQEKQQAYDMFCDTRNFVQKETGESYEKQSKEDKADFESQVSTMNQLLNDPDKTLNESTKDDSAGALAPIILCASIDLIKEKVLESGCMDLDGKKVSPAKAKKAVAVCAKMAKAIKDKFKEEVVLDCTSTKYKVQLLEAGDGRLTLLTTEKKTKLLTEEFAHKQAPPEGRVGGRTEYISGTYTLAIGYTSAPVGKNKRGATLLSTTDNSEVAKLVCETK